MPSRLIKPSIRTSPNLARISDAAFRLWAHLLTTADDFGLFEACADIVRGCAVPKVHCTPQDVAQWLDELEAEKLIKRYSAGDERTYGHFLKFSEHNRKPRSEPRYPTPPWMQTNDSNCPQPADSCGQPRPDRIRIRIRDRMRTSADSASPQMSAGKKPKKPAPPEALDLAQRFRRKQTSSDVRCEGTDEAWAKALDQVHRLDGYPWDEITAVLSWVTTDRVNATRGDWDGWADKVRSLAGIRVARNGESKWSKIHAAYQQAMRGNKRAHTQPHGDALPKEERLAKLAAEEAEEAELFKGAK